MDTSAVVVVIVLTALAFGSLVWMQIHSQKTALKEKARASESYEVNEEQNVT